MTDDTKPELKPCAHVAEALEQLEEIRTEKLAAAGFYVYATAISTARVALDRATRDLAKRDAELESKRQVIAIAAEELVSLRAERDIAKADAADSDRAHDARVSECERQADVIAGLRAELAGARKFIAEDIEPFLDRIADVDDGQPNEAMTILAKLREMKSEV